MRRYSLTDRSSRGAVPRGVLRARMRWTPLAIALTCVVSLVLASGARAVVVNDQGTSAGVALVPGTSLPGAVTADTSTAQCIDPALPPDLILPNTGLCSHGGNVMHQNETFALTWDPDRRYWASTRGYVEQFLSDVASGSGTFSSPYAVTGQYTDGSGRAANSSLYGGGCVDFGNPGGFSCQFANANGSGSGNNYPGASQTGSCVSAVSGVNQFHEDSSGGFGDASNDICLTDSDIQSELSTIISQAGLLGRTKPGYTPLVVLMTPPGLEVCLDSSGTLCSANSGSASSTAGKFCSYHSQVDVGGTEVAYVVQPWTVSWTAATGCDDPGVAPWQADPTPQQLATGAGARLVSPLSQGQLAAIVNPGLNGWFNNASGSEINDNGCVPLPNGLDSATVGSSAQNPYYLQREFNNAGVIESDPNALACEGQVLLSPTFVVPSAVNQGDTVEFDGSTTASSLIVPASGYAWDFGDGTTAVGPSVVHSYANGGTYTVKLTVTDRGGNVASLSQTIAVLGSNGQSVPAGTTQPTGSGGAGGSGGGTTSAPALRVRILLMPQALRAVLRSGIAVRVSSNEAANGFATVSITRSTAKRVHIKGGHGPSVVIGRGTVSGVTAGTVTLRLHLSRGVSSKLKSLRHVTLTVRLALVAAAGDHFAIDAAGRY